MSPEAWTFWGIVVVTLGGLLTALIAKQNKTNKVVSGEAGDPSIRTMLQTVISTQAANEVAHARYHAEQEMAINELSSKVDTVKDRQDSLEAIVLEHLELGTA